MSKWKLFLDHVTDTEDALQRMVALCHEADVALAASDAADHLVVLAQTMMRRGDQVPVPETATY